MRKYLCLILVALFLIPVLAFCEEKTEEAETTMGMGMMMGRGMTGKNINKGEFYKYSKMGMGKMLEKQIVATSDGGVIVLFGNKLLKYDRKLNLVNEAEIKIDIEAMKAMMERMQEMYPLHMKRKQHEGGCVAEEKAEEEAQEAE
ncbi:MAG: hypothetical protein DRZ76_00205 [Candidatus Nealsonbacteria bacterium]|nr:MAG: hypothetical protein DRZ76_00205 [Candidatus Nealsonbacteria bacterium]